MTMQGLDISHWQQGLDLASVEPDFVIIKATEGANIVDSQCDRFYQQAKRLGIPRGVYHFARPSKNTAKAEAEFFVKSIKGYIGESILVLDWEDSTKTPAWALEWLNTVYKLTGVRPLIYMSSSVVNSLNWYDVVVADYGLWVANYGVNNGQQNARPSVKCWPNYAMWQYTSKGRLSGYNGDLDLDVFFGDVTAWNKYAGKTGNTSCPENPNNSKQTTESEEKMYNEFLGVENYEQGERKLIEHLGIFGKGCDWGTDRGDGTGGYLGDERRKVKNLEKQLADTKAEMSGMTASCTQEYVTGLEGQLKTQAKTIAKMDEQITTQAKTIRELQLKLDVAETSFVNKILKLFGR